MKKTLQNVLLATTIILPCLTYTTENAGVHYSIQHNDAGDAYQIIANANQTPSADVSLTGQVTFKVPHTTDDKQAFVATDIISHTEGVQWIESSRVNAPKEAPNNDYISFSFISVSGSANGFQWKSDESKPLFSFKNSNGAWARLA